ncbi:inositol polyphosphate 1-phosphatase [Aethina tumida]|uniref:inositol polyphosphate 1-phosphatase n=1 Tax=Aethina tumida TaxID=116153 RepID=UPI00214807ED|nr:inositol polyphosphate 1-phosphatase [Aethina tumida]
MDLLRALIVVSEKAANVARICRQDKHLFELLVQKKKASEANPRFVDDFKTLADVLIQEMVKHDIGNKFPGLANDIRGEENNVFCNKLGESINVQVMNSVAETSNLLQKVLNGDEHAANLLATEVHREIKMQDVDTELPIKNFDVDINNVGIWIDPIDCTGEYINGVDSEFENGLYLSGLRCVTVLIGAYNKETQLPIMGIINQPFVEEKSSRWKGRCIWGVATGNHTSTSQKSHIPRHHILCLSSTESIEVKIKLQENGFKLAEASGAGYKILSVILGLADAYILSRSSTYKWDTCAPHAILKSLGGDIFIYEEALQNKMTPIKYPPEAEGSKYSNCGGLIAYKDPEVLSEVLSCLI